MHQTISWIPTFPSVSDVRGSTKCMKFLLSLLLVIVISACGSTSTTATLSPPISSLDSAPPTQQAGNRAISLPLPSFIPNRIPLAETDLASFPLPIQISNYTLIWDAQIDDAPTRTLAQSMPGSGVTFAANELDPGTYTLTATAYSPSDADLITPQAATLSALSSVLPPPHLAQPRHQHQVLNAAGSVRLAKPAAIRASTSISNAPDPPAVPVMPVI